MVIECFECKGPIDVKIDDLAESFIPPDLCICEACSRNNDLHPDLCKYNEPIILPKISYSELREKERDELKNHQWFISEKAGQNVGQEYSESDWRKHYETNFLKKWGYS